MGYNDNDNDNVNVNDNVNENDNCMATYLERIDQLNPDLIAGFLATGEGDGIPADLRLFMQQLQWAMEIYEHERSIRRCAQKLRQRVAATQLVSMEQRTAIARVYEALNFFHVDQNVPIKVWEALYADQFEKIAMMAAMQGDLKTQSKATERALECRRRAADISDTDRSIGVKMYFSTDLTPELLGLETQNLRKIAHKDNQGIYLRMIDQLPIEPDEKKRLLRDADIEEAELLSEE